MDTISRTDSVILIKICTRHLKTAKGALDKYDIFFFSSNFKSNEILTFSADSDNAF